MIDPDASSEAPVYQPARGFFDLGESPPVRSITTPGRRPPAAAAARERGRD